LTVRSYIASLDRGGYGRIALIAAMAVLLVGLPVPIPIRALLEVGIMAAAGLVTITGLFKSSRMQIARIAFLVMLALYVVLLSKPNVPDLSSGLEGIRYTMVAISGLMLGLGLPDRDGDPVGLIKILSVLLLIGAIASLAVHALAPGYEESLSRSADIATSMLGGEMRMQGLLSGPFHVSMLGSFLTLAGAWILPQARRRGGWFAIAGLAFLGVGIALLLLAKVRTGMIVTGLGLIVLLVVGVQQGPGFGQFLRSLKPSRPRDWLVAAAVVVVLTGFGVAASHNVAVQEIGHLPHDHRVNSRVDAIEASWDVATDSLVTGWGPGSASSGLRQEFVDAGKTFEAPHNGALGLVIEGGLGALLAFLLIFGTALVNLFREFRLGRQKPATGIALAAIMPVLGFWVVGDALAAIPISLCLCLIAGIYLANGIALDHRGETAGE
jgi:hypothetical protein